MTDDQDSIQTCLENLLAEENPSTVFYASLLRSHMMMEIADLLAPYPGAQRLLSMEALAVGAKGFDEIGLDDAQREEFAELQAEVAKALGRMTTERPS